MFWEYSVDGCLLLALTSFYFCSSLVLEIQQPGQLPPKICLTNVLIQMLLWSVVTLFTMTWHQKQIFLTNILPPFPQHRTPYSLKYFLDFIGVLIYLFLPSQLSPLMFTMYYYLLILINRKALTTCLEQTSQKLRSISCHSFQSSLQLHPNHFSLPYSMENCVSNPTSQIRFFAWCKKLQTDFYCSLLSKVFEKLIHKHLYSYFETNNLLYNRNSGFRKYHL